MADATAEGESERAAAADALRADMQRLENLVRSGAIEPQVVRRRLRSVSPAWRRVTEGEARLAPSLAILIAAVLQFVLPTQLAFEPVWVLPVLEVALLLLLVVLNPGRISRESGLVRATSLVTIGVIALANSWSTGRLLTGLLGGGSSDQPGPLLGSGAAIWFTNVVVFALLYWELDMGGPAARAHGRHGHPDFLFAQMQSPETAPPDWEPRFVDYFYLAFTNATAFSPTDVLPLARWAKLLMLAQSVIALVTVALVIARAVNILR
jgi:hypothetical protein